MCFSRTFARGRGFFEVLHFEVNALFFEETGGEAIDPLEESQERDKMSTSKEVEGAKGIREAMERVLVMLG